MNARDSDVEPGVGPGHELGSGSGETRGHTAGDADRGDAWSGVTRSPGGWRGWSDVTRSDDRWSEDPVGWAMPMVCARHLRRAGAWMGAVAALGGALGALVLTVLLWLVQAQATGSPGSAMRAGILAFLAAQHGGVTVDGELVHFLPLGLLGLAAVLPWRAGRALAALADDRGQRSGLRAAFGRLVAGYVAAVVVLAVVGRVGTSHPEFVATVLAAAVLAAVVAGLGARVELSRRDAVAVVPARWATTVRAAGAGVVVLTAMASLLLAAALAWHGGRVMELSHALGGGFAGVPVLLVGVGSAPNAVVAVGALLAGPGFAVGTDTALSVGGSTSGLVPAVPLLGALPSGDGPHVVVIVWSALTLVGIGLAVSRVLGRSRTVADALRRHLAAAALAGVAMAFAAWLAGGALGAGRLRAVGASPWQAGLAVGGQVLVAGLAVAVLRATVRLVRVRADEVLDVAPAAVVDTVMPALARTVTPERAGRNHADEPVDPDGDSDDPVDEDADEDTDEDIDEDSDDDGTGAPDADETHDSDDLPRTG